MSEAQENQEIRVVIVDDEPPARRRLRALLDRRSDARIVGEASSAREAVEVIAARAPDLVFLDVQMPGGDGFSVIEALDPATVPEVVFVTAFDQHALRAFEASALDYLLKPFDDRRFDRAFERAAEALRRRHLAGLCDQLRTLLGTGATPIAAKPVPDRLVIRSSGRVRLIDVREIDWIEAAGTYARLHLGGSSMLLRKSLAHLERRLGAGFVRIHRSTMVNRRRVRELRPQAHGESRVLLDDGTELKLSRGYRDRLEHLLCAD